MTELPTVFDKRFLDPKLRAETAKTTSRRSVDPELLLLVREFNSRLTASSKREHFLSELELGNAVCVFTGQQVGAFLSPALVLYKTLAAIKAAEKLSQETGVTCVPCFWLQTEDHDFEEIHSTSIFGSGGELINLYLEEKPKIERQSVQYVELGESVNLCNSLLEQHLARFPDAANLLAAVKKYYQPGNSVANAFCGLLAEITADYGLLFFNPQHSGIAKFKLPVIRQAWKEYQTFSELTFAATEKLRSQEIPIQVGLRANSPLFFYHPQSAEGSRFRIELSEGSWKLVGTDESVSSEQISEQIEKYPERFTTSALLRPILQSSLFPVVAYVAGPAELRYYEQLKPLYEQCSLVTPLLLPRPEVVIYEPKAQDLLSELGISREDLNLSDDLLVSKMLDSSTNPWLSPAKLTEQVDRSLAEIFALYSRNIEALDSSLMRPYEKSKQRMEHVVAELNSKYLRSAGDKNEVALARLQRLRRLIQPTGQDQERVISPLSYLCRYGTSLLDRIYQEIEPFSKQKFEINI